MKDAISTDAASRPRASWRLVTYLTGAHTVHDMSLGTLGVLLPFLREKLGFSLFLAGLLVPAQQTGSLLQPVMGYLADKFGKRRFVVTFLTVTSVVMSMMGLSFHYIALIVIVTIGGLSSAAYHPAGSSLVTNFAGDKWGTGLAIYHFGGNIGLAVGPIAAAWVVSEFGLEQTWILLIPGALLAAFLLRAIPETGGTGSATLPGRQALGWIAKHRKAFGSLGVIVFGRAVGAGGLGLFLPTLLLERGYSLAVIAGLTSGFFAVGGLGGLVTGWLSDRVGRHKVIRLMLFIGPFALLGFLRLGGLWAIALLLVASVSLRGEQPVIMAMIQEWAPERRGTVVGFVLGMQFVLAGIGTSAVGWMADSMGLTNAFQVVALTPLIGIPLIGRLPVGRLEDPEVTS